MKNKRNNWDNWDNVIIWFRFEIEPVIRNFFQKLSLRYKHFVYINGIKTIGELIREMQYNEHRHPDSYMYYNGIVKSIPPIQPYRNKPVITNYGVGIIRHVTLDDMSFKDHARVEFMTTTFHKSRGYIKTLKLRDLKQLVIYHELSNQFILLSPKDYVYIVDDEQPVVYRLTERKYATLSPDYKAEFESVKIFNSHRGGAEILQELTQKGFKIIKE